MSNLKINLKNEPFLDETIKQMRKTAAESSKTLVSRALKLAFYVFLVGLSLISVLTYFMGDSITGVIQLLIALNFSILIMTLLPTRTMFSESNDEIGYIFIVLVIALLDFILMYSISGIHYLLVTFFFVVMAFLFRYALKISIHASDSYIVIEQLREAYIGHEKELVNYIRYPVIKAYIEKLDRKVVVAEFDEIKRFAKEEMERDTFRECSEKVYPQLSN